jgi:predicted AAA+ superfamily ATPase
LPKLPKRAIYIDLELPSDFNKLRDPELYLTQHAEECVVVDEIQKSPDLFPLMRALVDQKREPGRFIVLGSASPDLLQQSSESLAGRISYVELLPFSLDEMPPHFSMIDHWFTGGFPSAFLARSAQEKALWIDEFIRTYTERDLPQLGMPAGSLLIRRLWTMLAHINGQLLNLSDISKSLGISVPAVKSYIDFMEQAFLVFRIYPFRQNIKKRLVKTPKAYLTDTGVYHRLLNIRNYEELLGHVYLGRSWENYVITQIRSLIAHPDETYFYRTHDGSECDLVIVKGGIPLAGIEIKYTSTPKMERGLTTAFADIDTRHNFIITPGSEDYLLRANVRACSLVRFLEVHLPRLMQ